MDVDPIPLLMLAVSLALVALAAAIEIAFATVDRGHIRELAEQDNPRAQTVESILGDPPQFFITMMLLKTAGLVGAGLATAHLVSGAFTAFTLLLIGLALWLIMALIQVVTRALTQYNADGVALRLAALVSFVSVILTPIIALLRKVGMQVGDDEGDATEESVFLTEDGLRLLINVRDEEDAIEESEKQMIASILDMEETVAREVMVPRIDMVVLNIETPLRDALDVIIDAGHSRIPVYEGNVDKILGVLYAKDLLQCYRDNDIARPIRELLRPAHFVPVSKTLDTLFSEMQKRRVHIVIIIDEYGGTAGLVTIEDILEEIVGEIQDEYDEVEIAYVQTMALHTYLLNARLDLDTLSELLAVDLPDENADTVGGLIYSLLGHVPEPGESVEFEGWLFTVLTVDGRRIEQVRVEPSSPPLAADSEEAAEKGKTDLSGQGSILNFLTFH